MLINVKALSISPLRGEKKGESPLVSFLLYFPVLSLSPRRGEKWAPLGISSYGGKSGPPFPQAPYFPPSFLPVGGKWKERADERAVRWKKWAPNRVTFD